MLTAGVKGYKRRDTVSFSGYGVHLGDILSATICFEHIRQKFDES